MTTELIPLGTNGYFPSHGRHTMSYLLLRGPEAVLLDAGTGIARLSDDALRPRLDGCEKLHVILSHYHHDHTAGLFYLIGIWRDRPIEIFAPGKPFVDTDARASVERLFTPPFVNVHSDVLKRIAITPYNASELSIGDFHFCLWSQEHPGQSVGMRIDDTLAYTTDKSMNFEHAKYVSHVNLLLHEVWLTDEEAAASPDDLRAHCTLGDVARFASEAGVQRLAPVHHHPRRTADDVAAIRQDLQNRSGIETLLLQEGNAYRLD